MSNEVFSFQRFWTYFKYDLVQLGRRHFKPALLISGSGLILYVTWVMGALVFSQHWAAPSIEARVVVAFMSATALELFYAYLYGFVTDRRKGSSYLMVPASTTEKFVSILINALVVVPLLFLVVCLGVDALICLLDPTAGDMLLTSGWTGVRELLENLSAHEEAGFFMSSVKKIVVMTLVSGTFNFLYFVLCGMCFKKSKIMGAIGIALGVSFAFSIISGLFAPQMADWFRLHDFADAETVKLLTSHFITWMNVLIGLGAIGIGWGIFHRLKTLTH